MEIDYLVCKSNDLIQKASYSLSATEQKLLLYVISKIKPTDTEFENYTFRMVDLLEIFGLDYSKRSTDQLRNGLRKLREKEVYIKTPAMELACGWLNEAVFYKDTYQTVSVSINKRLAPYLLDLSQRYTAYQLRNIMAMKSKHSIRLYEVAESYLFQNQFLISVEFLKRMLQCENYSWRDLKSKVLDPAMKEINLMSDILIGYRPIRQGHAYTDLKFTINKKDTLENFTAQTRQNMILYGY